MKVSRWTAMSVMVSLVAAPASSQIPQDLDPSLKIFSVISKPMPSFDGVAFYKGLPDGDGTITLGVGHSSMVRAWFPQMEPLVPKFEKSEERLRLDFNVYADTVREDGAEVLKAATKLKPSLLALDTPTRGRLLDLFGEYNDRVRAAHIARIQYGNARKEAQRAQFLLDASDADAKECNLLLERARLEVEQAAAQAKIRKGQAFLRAVETAIGKISGGPTAVAGYLLDEVTTLTVDAARTLLVEAFYSGTMDTLYEIGLKIEAIDKSLQDLKCKSQTAKLQAAKLKLETTMSQALLAFGEIVMHRAKAWNAIDRIADTGRALPFFVRLQTYNRSVNQMGRKVFDSLTSHLDLLAREPLSRAHLLLAYVNEDIQTIERDRAKRDPHGAWLGRANQLKAYWGRYTSWHDGEIGRGQTALEHLREARHLDFVDRMIARATKDLGGTVSYEDIIR